MTGHLTENVYRRYAIVDAVMLHEAAAKLDALQISERLGPEPSNEDARSFEEQPKF